MHRPKHFTALIIAAIFISFIGFQPLTRAQVLPITTSSEQAKEYFKEAREFAFHWETDPAIRLLKKAVALDSSFVLAYLHLTGLSHYAFQKRQYIKSAEENRSRVTEGEQKMIDVFRAAFIDAEYEKAVSILNELSDEYPDDPYLPGYAGIRCCWYLNRCDEAAKYFNDALNRDPDFVQAYHLLGETALNAENFDEAEKYFNKYLQSSPDHWNAHISMADLYLYTGREEEAEKEFARAMEIDPTGEARNVAALVDLEHDRMDEAEKFFKENVKIHPDDPEMYNSLGEYFMNSDRYDEAEQQFKKALAIDKGFEESRNNLVQTRIMQANKKFCDAFSNKDAGTIAELYTSKAKLLPAGTAPVGGREEIRKFWRNAIDAGITGIDLQTMEVYIGREGETATEVGKYKLTAGKKTADDGKYVVIWKLLPDGWKLHRDIWTTNQVPAPADSE